MNKNQGPFPVFMPHVVADSFSFRVNMVTRAFGPIVTINTTPTQGGSGYEINDIVTIYQSFTGNGEATGRVLAVDTENGNACTLVELVNPGADYVTGDHAFEGGGGGSGCRIDVTAINPILQFTIPTSGTDESYSFNYDVDWGDGNTSHITTKNAPSRIHTYATEGNYDIKITGLCEYFKFPENGQPQSSAPSQLAVTSQLGVKDIGLKALSFAGCSNLTTVLSLGTMASLVDVKSYLADTAVTTVPATLFAGCPNIATFERCFERAPLAELPANFFRYNLLATSFLACFRGCPMDTVPADTFKYNEAATNFDYLFFESSLEVIPTDLFRFNVLVSSFSETFNSCTSLLAIPVDIFRYNTALTNVNQVFKGCTSLTTVPTDLLRYNVSLSSCNGIFDSCSNLQTVPDYLFAYNTVLAGFDSAFLRCPKLTVNPKTFWFDGERDTRFHDQNVSFQYLFYLDTDTFTGTQGTAPDLWSCDYGDGSAGNIDNAFTGHTTSSLTNQASIPATWGGPA